MLIVVRPGRKAGSQEIFEVQAGGFFGRETDEIEMRLLSAGRHLAQPGCVQIQQRGQGNLSPKLPTFYSSKEK
jgi:hypothetical protein